MKLFDFIDKQMNNEFLPICYFENEIEYLLGPSYSRLTEKMDQTMDQLIPYPKASQYAIRRLSKQLIQCYETYGLLKLLLMAHNILRNIPMGKLLLLDALSEIYVRNLSQKHRFESFLINNIIKDYIEYLRRMCAACRIYSYCIGLFTQDQPSLYFFGAINLIQYCWPILDKFKALQPILKQTYPFLLDIYMCVVKDAKDFIISIWDLLKQMSSSSEIESNCAWQTVIKQLLEINHKIQALFQNQMLQEEVGAPELEQVIQITDFCQEDLKEFMDSNFKQKKY